MNDHDEEYRSLIELPKGEQEIPWKSSKDEQWALLEGKLGTSKSRSVFMHRPAVRLAIAAAILVLVAFSAFIRFYSVEHVTLNGQQQVVTLPDGSTTKLNAGSQLSYNPYWWNVSREINFEGEGYFEVQKGSDFTVFSKFGSTTVLGTKFNIYARKTNYRVTCFEGSVRVNNETGGEVVIKPNQKAVGITKDILVEDINQSEVDRAWRDNYFMFTSTNIMEVIEEIERQYNLKVEYTGEELFYTGNFTRDQTIDRTLSIVSLSLNLQIEKKNSTTYILK